LANMLRIAGRLDHALSAADKNEWMYDSQKKPNSNLRKLLQELIEKVNPRHTLAAEEHRQLS
jgi:hypothetical protein